MKRVIYSIMFCVFLSFVSGCATILSHGDKTIPIISDPEGANIEVRDKRMDKTISKNKAPCQITFERGDGWFLKKYYNLNVTKEGYISETMEVTPTFNPLYICNLILGGAIGMLFVDSLTGDMWQYYVDKIDIKLYLDTPEGKIAREEAIRRKLAQEEALSNQQQERK
jgi:hypothetical protein